MTLRRYSTVVRSVLGIAVLVGSPIVAFPAESEAAAPSPTHVVEDQLPEGYFQESYVHNAMATYFEIVVFGDAQIRGLSNGHPAMGSSSQIDRTRDKHLSDFTEDIS